MAIRWIGKIEDENISAYQRGQLPKNAVEIKSPNSMKEMQIKAIPFQIPSCIILVSIIIFKAFSSSTNPISMIFIFIGLVIGFVLLLVHEWLHGIVYPSKAEVSIGFMPKQFVAVALASYPLSRKRFCLMCLLPYILGIIPMILLVVFPVSWRMVNSILFGMAAMGLGSPSVDAYNVRLVLKNSPKGSKVQFYEDKLFWFYDK